MADGVWWNIRLGPPHLRHLDDLSTTEAEFLVVIQYSVHALDPQSVHWSVKHEPLLVRSIVGHSLSDEAGYDTIRPGERKREIERGREGKRDLL